MSVLEILLSTYNGERFLGQQLQSLVDQTFRNWRLIVRDDGSDDTTPEIIKSFAENHNDRVHIVDSDGRLGPCGGFSKLMAASEADYIMFCDQDDLWLPDKIEKILACMKQLEAEKGSEVPLLVHCDLIVGDRDLKPIHDSFWSYQGIAPENAGRLNRQLVMNTVTGCAMMINRPLLALAAPIPDESMVHDWWIAIVAAAFGSVSWVPEPLIIYRQHEKNSIGAEGYSAVRFMRKIWKYLTCRQERLRLKKLSDRHRRQIYAFRERYGQRLSDRQEKVLTNYFRFCAAPPFFRFFIMARFGFWRTGLLRNIAMGMSCHFNDKKAENT